MNSRPKISIIVAMARNQVIGRSGGLPWKLSADLQRFKQLTMGHPIIMGRKTYDSIGKPLPGRTSIVVSRSETVQAPGVITARGLPEALQAAENSDEAFVIGGGQIYSQTLPLADRLYITIVETDSEGDTFFPPWNPGEWRLVEESAHPADSKNAYPMQFRVFDRITPTH